LIIETYLVRVSNREILATAHYWPIDIDDAELTEYLATREEIQSASGSEIAELPLIIGDNKYLARDIASEYAVVFVADTSEDERSMDERLREAAAIMSKEVLRSGIESVISRFASLIESYVITKLKIALVGEGGVGKTTTLHLLLGDTPPTQYVPTIALNLETVENIKFGSYSLVLWDFAGQERFRKLWRFYFHGADVIFLVCDSSLRNVIISKDILKLIRRDAPKVPVFAIANKQDKPNVMKPEVIQKILGIPTYPMVAIDKSRRDEMLGILMNAAAHYVGVALPDLPTDQLLRFTDEATVDAIAEVEARAQRLEAEAEASDDFDTIEVVEEVFVDEDGQIIEDSDEYEIVEEVVEEVEDIFGDIDLDEEEEIEEVVVEPEPTEDVEPEPEPEEEEPEEEEPAEVEEEEEEVPEEVVVDEVPVEEPVDVSTEPIRFEVECDEASESTTGVDIEFEEMPTASEPTEDVIEVVQVATETGASADVNGTKMAIDLIVEALEADEVVSAAIEEVSTEELDTALEAFSSSEVLPLEGETDEERDIDDEAKRELTLALGELDSIYDKGSVEEDSESPRDLDRDAILELDAILDRKTKGSDSESE
jgi:small GTP-binding protein